MSEKRGQEYEPAGDTYPTLRPEAERILARELPDFDFDRMMVSKPDANGIVKVFVPYTSDDE